MNTKIYIQYKEPRQKKWQYASCIVFNENLDAEFATELLEWGNIHNNFIQELVDYSEFNCLDTWEVILVESTNEESTSFITLNDKPQFIIDAEKATKLLKAEIKKIEAETKKMNKKAELLRLKNEALDQATEELKEDNLKILANEWHLNSDEIAWFNDNFEKVKKYADESAFRLNPESLKRLYKEDTGKNPSKTVSSVEPVEEVKETTSYIEVLGKRVNPQLFKDYVYHLQSAKRTSRWDVNAFENKRVILHERLFEALGGDRIEDHDGEIGQAINSVVCELNKCSCGGSINGYKRCDDCGVTFSTQSIDFNLEMLTKNL